MTIPTSISRLAVFYKRHGLGKTLQRTGLAAKRLVLSNRSVVFCCDLSRLASASAELPKTLKVERKRSEAEIDPRELQQIVEIWNAAVAQQRMKERFDQGACLWLIKFDGRLAGYGWTLQGRTIAPYYFPLAENDVQFFDFHVFQKFRGRAIDWFLMTRALHELAADGAGRAFAEAGEWNQASLSSIAATPFRRMGMVRSVTVLGRTIVSWAGKEPITQASPVAQKSRAVSAGTQSSIR